MCPTALILILCAKKKRPQPGEDGYGRLVRVQLGRGGMMVRVPSNRNLTSKTRKSSVSLLLFRTDEYAGGGTGLAGPNAV